MNIAPGNSTPDITEMLMTNPKTASNYTDAFDILLDAYKDIGNNLPQFEKYGKLFGNKRSVRKVLLEVFEGILRFHKRAMGFFRRSGSSLLPSICCNRASWDCLGAPRASDIGDRWGVLKYSRGLETDIYLWISLETTV